MSKWYILILSKLRQFYNYSCYYAIHGSMRLNFWELSWIWQVVLGRVKAKSSLCTICQNSLFLMYNEYCHFTRPNLFAEGNLFIWHNFIFFIRLFQTFVFIRNTPYGRFERAMTVNDSKIVPHIVNDSKIKLLIDIMETSTVMAGDQTSEDSNGDGSDYGTCFLSAI